MSNSKFVGRVKELNRLLEALNKKSNLIFLISGIGAIGKTWLSLEFYKKIRDNKNVLNTKLIDITNMAYKLPFLFLDEIIFDLSINNECKSFNVQKNEYFRLVRQQVDEDVLTKKKVEVYNSFINDLNSIDNRKVILIDTFDKIAKVFESSYIMDFINKIAIDLENTLIVISGREAKLQYLNKKLSKISTEIILEGFNREEVNDFVEIELNIVGDYTTEKKKEIEEIKEKVYYLSQGRPLLLHMANAYFKIEDLPYPTTLSQPLEILKPNSSDFIKKQEEFEFEMFRVFGNSYEKIEPFWPNAEIILLLALFEKRGTVGIIHLVTKKPISQIENFFNSDSAFYLKRIPDKNEKIGYRYYLQDVFRVRLKNEWNRIDRQFRRRKKIIEGLIDYYDKLILEKLDAFSNNANDTNSLEIDILELEKYFYVTEYLIEEKKEYIEQQIKQSIKNNNYKVFNEIWKDIFEKVNKYDDNTFNILKYQLARYLRVTSKYNFSEKILLELISKEHDDSLFKLECYQTLAFVYKDQGELEKAKLQIKLAEETINSLSELKIPDLYEYKISNLNNKGQILIDEGKFIKWKDKQKNNQKGAIPIFEEALKIAKDNNSINNICSIQQNLALSYILQGDLLKAKRAIMNAGIAISEIQHKDFRANLNNIYNARLETQNEVFEKAYQLYKTAEDFFKVKNNLKWKALITNYKSQTMLEEYLTEERKRHNNNFLKDQLKKLSEIYRIAKESNQECENYYSLYYPESLINTANVEIEFAKYYDNKNKLNKSISYYNKANDNLAEAKRLNNKKNKNKRISCNILDVKAKYYFHRYRNAPKTALEKIEVLLNDFKKLEIEETSFIFYKGKILLRLGDLNYSLNIKDKAFSYYKLSLPLFAKPSYNVHPFFYFQLSRICDKLLLVNKESFYKWHAEYLRYWTNLEISITHKTVIKDNLEMLVIKFKQK